MEITEFHLHKKATFLCDRDGILPIPILQLFFLSLHVISASVNVTIGQYLPPASQKILAEVLSDQGLPHNVREQIRVNCIFFFALRIWVEFSYSLCSSEIWRIGDTLQWGGGWGEQTDCLEFLFHNPKCQTWIFFPLAHLFCLEISSSSFKSPLMPQVLQKALPGCLAACPSWREGVSPLYAAPGPHSASPS